MLIYFILLVIVVILANGYDRSKSGIYLVFILLFMTLLAGLRDVNVGTDSWSYYFQFDDRTLWTNFNFFENLTQEVGFKALLWLSQVLGSNYCVLFTLVAGVVYSLTLIGIKKYSESMLISLFVYITLGQYAFCFNGERQALAIAIYILAIQYIKSRDFKKYCLIVLIAALFHKTIIVAIPLYFLFIKEVNMKTAVYIVMSSIILTLLLPSLLEFASKLESRYANYDESTGDAGLLLMFAYYIITIFFMYSRKYIEIDKLQFFDVCLLMFIAGSTIFTIVLTAGIYIEVSRFASYFHISAIFLWPMILHSKMPKKFFFISVAYFLGHLSFMYVYYNKMAGLSPYIFNRSLFLN